MKSFPLNLLIVFTFFLKSFGHAEVWPKPIFRVSYHDDGFMLLPASSFRFNVVEYTCDILESALKRYHGYLLLQHSGKFSAERFLDSNTTAFRGNLEELKVALMAPCEEYPYFGMDEHYELRIDSDDVPKAAILVAHSVWGVMRGLETFVQLAVPAEENDALLVSSCLISDYPRYPHRGLMIDTSRHFLPLKTLFTLVDGMEASRLNVLHWHMTDDEAFPFRSARFPEFSEKGAFHPYTHIYTLNDVKSVVEYCKLRGIRVIPEFDTPGHCRSWGQLYPHLLTKCYDENGEADGTLGPMDPTSQFTFGIVRGLIAEVSQVFYDSHMHLGGNDVQLDCWKSNPGIKQYLEENGMAGEYRALEGVFVDQLADFVTNSLDRQKIVWQDLFDNGAASLDEDTVVQVWKPERFHEELQKITEKGHLALLSACWQLDDVKSKWRNMYKCEPSDFVGGQPDRVIGGEAMMWTHYVDHTNIVSRVFPRVAAMAERLWSSANSLDVAEATARMDQFQCLLARRGVNAEPPNGPGFCSGEIFKSSNYIN